jgi:hypothetical protein
MVVRSAGIVALRITACIKKTKKNQKEEFRMSGSKAPKNIDIAQIALPKQPVNLSNVTF